MLQRFKGVTATLADWEASTKKIPEEVWAIVVTEGSVSNPGKLGIKLGTGRIFSETPYIISPAMLEEKIPKPILAEPSANKFLSQDGEYYEIDLTGFQVDVDTLLTQFDEAGLEVTTKDQVDWIRAQMYAPPSFSSFSSTSSFIGALEMGTTILGTMNFSWGINNSENLQSVSINVSEGVWNNSGLIATPKITRKITLDGQTAISSTSIKTITFSLSGVDINGNPMGTKTLQSVFTHRIHYGTISNRTITSFADITAKKSVLSNSRNHTVGFTPNGSQYSIILIPIEIAQSGINIVNVNAPNIDHSYNMNEGEGGTLAKYTIVNNGITYNAYVSYGATSGASSAQIK